MMPLRALSAQETAVLYGSMRDSSGQPLRATVRVVNGAAASVADAQGRYQLSVPAGLVIVRVGFLGYRSLDDTLTLAAGDRSEEHTSELQSHSDLVCRLLLEKKKKNKNKTSVTTRIRQKCCV